MLIGTAVGVLPGIGPAMTVALLLPLTYTLDPTAALITFAGIYYGGMYGGSTTSILLNTPGESASIITAIEGNKMARMGRAAAALATAAIGSFVAGTIATVGLTLLAPIIAQFAVELGPADYVALIVVAFITVGALLGSSVSRGLASLGIGLFIGLVGTDLLTGQARYTLGLLPLADGIDVVLVAVGLFAVGETLYVASRMRHGPVQVIPVGGSWRHWMKKRGLEALVEAVAARHRHRVPHRDDPGRRRGRGDVPVVRGGEEAVASTRRSSETARSRASQARSRPTTPPPRACWCPC